MFSGGHDSLVSPYHNQGLEYLASNCFSGRHHCFPPFISSFLGTNLFERKGWVFQKTFLGRLLIFLHVPLGYSR